MGDQLGQRHRLRLGDRSLAGAFQDEVPGVGIGEAAGCVQGRAKPAQQGAVSQGDIGQVTAGGGKRCQFGRVGAVGVGALQPARVQPGQEVTGTRRRARRGGDGQGDHGLGDVGVVGGAAGSGVDHLEQHHRQFTRRQRP